MTTATTPITAVAEALHHQGDGAFCASFLSTVRVTNAALTNAINRQGKALVRIIKTKLCHDAGAEEEGLMQFLHPANVDELANIAAETGAEVLRGPLRYPSESGGWQLGDLDLSEHMVKYRDHEVTVIIAVTGEADKERVICGICGFALDDVGECPRCKLTNERMAKLIRKRREETAAMFREAESIVRDEDE